MSALASRFVCRGCGAALAADEPLPFRCPRARAGDGIDHVLARELELTGDELAGAGDDNPFVRYRALLHSWRFARRRGLSDGDWIALARTLDDALAEVDGGGFRTTPYREASELGRALGLGAGRLWIKDETQSVAGSHKARHLMGIALQLAVAGVDADARLAIASCGNAALAAAVVARAARRPLAVFVPPWANPTVVARLAALGAELFVCARASGMPPGDPCYHRFRAALEQGALPFTCQGNENGLAIEGGATLALELVAQHARASPRPLERLLVQVGGGALASACIQGLREARALGALTALPRIDTVQTEGAHPLERAWRGVAERVAARLEREGLRRPDAPAGEPPVDWIRAAFDAHRAAIEQELAGAARERGRYMWPWEEEPKSAASGILDDETYDWLAVVRGMLESGGRALVVDEAAVLRARALGRQLTGIDVDATGTAGLAGLVGGRVSEGEEVAVLFTGVQR